MSTDPAARAAELRAEIEAHNRAYYSNDEPTVGDDVYDELLNELREIEAENPELLTPDSPTQRVGAAPRTEVRADRAPRADALAGQCP